MATAFPQRPTCRTCRYFDLAGHPNPDRGTCNHFPVGVNETPDEEGSFAQIPDPDVLSSRVACSEYTEFTMRGVQ
jgi:hypothetical protein